MLLFHYFYFQVNHPLSKGNTAQRNSRSSPRQARYSASVITNETRNTTAASSRNLRQTDGKIINIKNRYNGRSRHAKRFIKNHQIFTHPPRLVSPAAFKVNESEKMRLLFRV